MSSNKKTRKTSKRLHWGRGRNFLKHKGKGIKRVTFYTSSQRRIDKRIDTIE
jgi:hypothetical protein